MFLLVKKTHSAYGLGKIAEKYFFIRGKTEKLDKLLHKQGSNLDNFKISGIEDISLDSRLIIEKSTVAGVD